MAADRPEKQVIRDFWAQQASSVWEKFANDPQVPLYVTLSGAEGKDIKRLADEGLLNLTEVGGIATADQNKIVAVEVNHTAEFELRRRFPGLRTYREGFQNLVSGTGITSFPDKDRKRICRARIINLDLTVPLHGDANEDGELQFPVLTWIKKLCQMHAEPPRLEWCLCLTLQGGITWAPEISNDIQAFLGENFHFEKSFGELSRSFLGDTLYNQILGQDPLDFRELTQDERQKVLMAFVPKKITQLVHAEGWRVYTRANIRYGGREDHAPMVSWIFEFRWDRRYSRTPRAVYSDSLADVLRSVKAIHPDGRID